MPDYNSPMNICPKCGVQGDMARHKCKVHSTATGSCSFFNGYRNQVCEAMIAYDSFPRNAKLPCMGKVDNLVCHDAEYNPLGALPNDKST